MEAFAHAPKDFKTAAGLTGFLGHLCSQSAKEQIHLFANTYERQHPAKKLPCPDPIPKIIHQIWLGPKPLPKDYQAYGLGWQKKHPSWEYRLWRERDLETIPFKEKPYYDEAQSYGEKSDLARIAILRHCGGVYLDVDMECVTPLDPLRSRYQAAFCLRSIPVLYLASRKDYELPYICCNSFMMMRPHAPFLDLYFEKVAGSWQAYSGNNLTWRERYHPVRLTMPLAALEEIKRVVLRTYRPFHQSVFDYFRTDRDHEIVLPPPFFNPIDTQRSYSKYLIPFYFKALSYALKSRKTSFFPFHQVTPYTIGIHHSKATWIGGL